MIASTSDRTAQLIEVAIIRTGTANIASVMAAFRRLGAKTRIVDRPDELNGSDALVLPGVGAFESGMKALNSAGWKPVLAKRFEIGQPTLAICLGFQLLCRQSDENTGIHGLGILPTSVRRLPAHVSVPHFGWNEVQSNSAMIAHGFAYYANSYYVEICPQLTKSGWNVATTNHGIKIAAAVERESLLACQFHPELSGDFGKRLLKRWLQSVATKSAKPMNRERSPC